MIFAHHYCLVLYLEGSSQNVLKISLYKTTEGTDTIEIAATDTIISKVFILFLRFFAFEFG